MNETVPPTALSPMRLTEVLIPGDLPPGTFLHHFRVDRKIASGGMGAVYLGHDTSLDRPVALKTLRPEVAGDASFLARFQHEARSQANLVHPHVVQVYFVGEEHGVWFMAMQLVDGGSLQDAVERKGSLPWQEVAAHFVGLTDALVEAARMGIVHRDLKPANILVDRYGNAHLADFGLATGARLREETQTFIRGTAPVGSQVSTAGSVMGTLPYMPPEQLEGRPLDQRADVYGMGATIYQLLTGQMPVQASTPDQALQAIRAGIAPVRTKRSAVPAVLAEIVDRCLRADPADRFQSHQELLRAVRRAIPQPQVPPTPLVRALAGIIDLLPALTVLLLTLERVIWAAPLTLAVWLGLGQLALHASPGQWLMRLRLRTDADGDVSLLRGTTRAVLQWGGIALLAVAFLLTRASRTTAANAAGYLALVWSAVELLGLLPAVLRRPTLVDRLTRTRVLVDVR